MTKFSIIIPAYNMEGLLADCLLSIQRQSFADFEALIVDDGSTDGTGRVAQEFAGRDKRFKVLSKKNGGVSSARNLGLEKATGEFIWFIDGDDYIHLDSLAYLDKIYSIYPDADYVTFPFTQVFTSYAACEEVDNALSTDDVMCFDASEKEGFISAFQYSPREACLTCYKRSVLKNEKFELFRLGEDTLFAKQILYKSKKVIWAPDTLYFYYHREESASRVTLISHVLDYLKVCRELYKFKGKRNGWADNELAHFCSEVCLIDAMTRLQRLHFAQERHVAHQAWLSNAIAFLNAFAEPSMRKGWLHLVCWNRSYTLSWLFFYVRYLPRRFISCSPKVAAILRVIRILPAIKKHETDTNV